jgi:hypothetical protein
MFAPDVADFALQLDQMNGLIPKGIVVDHVTDLGGQFVEEQAVGLACHRPGIWVDWLGVGGGAIERDVDGGGTDLALLDQITDSLLPSSSGGIVMEYGIGIPKQPGIEMTHC